MQKVLDTVLAHPGATTRQVILLSGVPEKQVPQLLSKLVAMGRLATVMDGVAKVYLPALAGVHEWIEQFLALRHPKRARLFRHLRPEGMSRSEVRSLAEALGAKERSTAMHLAILARANLVQVIPSPQDPRRVLLRRLEPAPQVGLLLDVAAGQAPAELLACAVELSV